MRHIKVRASSDIDERAYGALLKQAARRRSLNVIAGILAAAALMPCVEPTIRAEVLRGFEALMHATGDGESIT